MNKKLIAVAIASALGAPGLALAQASSVQIYGQFSYGPEIRQANGGDGTTFGAAAAGANVVPGATSATVSSLRTTATSLGGNYIAVGTGLVPNVSSRSATSGSGSHWGLRGREDLGGGMYAGFQIETAIQGDAVTPAASTANGLNATYRNTGVWIGTPIGEFGTGHWDTPYSMIMNNQGVHSRVMGNSSTSASAAIFGGTTFAATTYSGQPINQTCNAAIPGYTTAKTCFASVTTFSRRQSNSIWWQSPNWSGFAVRAQMKMNFPEATTDPTVVGANTGLESSYWGLSGTYTAGPLFIGGSYERQDDLAAFGIRTFGTMVLGSDGTAANATPIAGFQAPNITGSKGDGWNINARYSFGGGFHVGAYYERLKWDFNYSPTAALPAGTAAWNANVTNLEKYAYRLDGAYQTGPHTISLFYNRTGDMSGSTIGAGFNGNDSSVQSWQLAYGYSLSKRTSVFGYYNEVRNDKNAQSSGVVFNGINTPVGGDPKYMGIGVRHSF